MLWIYDLFNLFFLQSSSTKQDWVIVFRKIKSRSFLHVLIRKLNLTPKPCFQGVDMWNLMKVHSQREAMGMSMG